MAQAGEQRVCVSVSVSVWCEEHKGEEEMTGKVEALH
jgi:hypothetical protein